MKALSLGATLVALLATTAAHAADLQIRIQGLRSGNGAILLDLHNDPTAFPRDAARAVKHIRIRAAKGTVATVIQGLPAGTYAFTFLHDENGNGKLDTNAIGIPTEGVGFSMDPTIGLSAPGFDRAAFTVTEGRSNVAAATVKYF